MRAWLILFMDLGSQSVHLVIPKQGPLDHIAPRKAKLTTDVEQQLDHLLASIDKLLGEATQLREPVVSIQHLLLRNNKVDLTKIMSETTFGKYLKHKSSPQIGIQ